MPVENTAANSKSPTIRRRSTEHAQKFVSVRIGPRKSMGYPVANNFLKVLLVALLRYRTVTLETIVTGDDGSVPYRALDHFAVLVWDLKWKRGKFRHTASESEDPL